MYQDQEISQVEFRDCSPNEQFIMTRRGLGRFVSFLLAVPVVSLVPSLVYAKPRKPWHSATQKERNAYIVELAEKDVGKNFNKNCKEWIRKVVKEASEYGGGEAVIIPPTSPDENGWAWEAAPYIYTPRQCRTIRTALPGQIIQMSWKNAGNGKTNPHTAIVGDVSTKTITFIDSNWPRYSGDKEHNWVQKRLLTYTEVEKAVGSKFTIYEIQ